MDYDALRAEIESGPLALELAPFLAVGDDARAAEVLNRQDLPARRLVPVDVLQAWMGEQGLTVAMEVALLDEETPQVMRGALLALDKLLQRLRGLDLDSAQGQALLGMFQQAGLVTVEQLPALDALADTFVSRAELAGLGTVHHLDIGRAYLAERLAAQALILEGG